jgi:hypothetical protein
VVTKKRFARTLGLAKLPQLPFPTIRKRFHNPAVVYRSHSLLGCDQPLGLLRRYDLCRTDSKQASAKLSWNAYFNSNPIAKSQQIINGIICPLELPRGAITGILPYKGCICIATTRSDCIRASIKPTFANAKRIGGTGDRDLFRPAQVPGLISGSSPRHDLIRRHWRGAYWTAA